MVLIYYFTKVDIIWNGLKLKNLFSMNWVGKLHFCLLSKDGTDEQRIIVWSCSSISPNLMNNMKESQQGREVLNQDQSQCIAHPLTLGHTKYVPTWGVFKRNIPRKNFFFVNSEHWEESFIER